MDRARPCRCARAGAAWPRRRPGSASRETCGASSPGPRRAPPHRPSPPPARGESPSRRRAAAARRPARRRRTSRCCCRDRRRCARRGRIPLDREVPARDRLVHQGRAAVLAGLAPEHHAPVAERHRLERWRGRNHHAQQGPRPQPRLEESRQAARRDCRRSMAGIVHPPKINAPRPQNDTLSHQSTGTQRPPSRARCASVACRGRGERSTLEHAATWHDPLSAW